MFKGGMGMNGMQGMLKKVQKMQSEMLKLQDELKERTVEATAGSQGCCKWQQECRKPCHFA